MSLFKNDWIRWFVGAFIVGAALPLGAFATDQFKDLEIGAGNLNFSGASAWVVATLFCGIFTGILGLGVASFKSLNRKSSG